MMPVSAAASGGADKIFKGTSDPFDVISRDGSGDAAETGPDGRPRRLHPRCRPARWRLRPLPGQFSPLSFQNLVPASAPPICRPFRVSV
jgi:hypothetical protein